MDKSLWQKLQPHVIAIAVFFVISCIYCAPAFKGMVVNQHDAEGWKGMAQQSLEFKEKYGYYPLWTNALFSGMPTFQIIIGSTYNITLAWFHYLLTMFLPDPAGLFFLACIGFYILSTTLGIRSTIGILGSLAYGFSSYNAVIVMVGHTTKFASMGYAPALLAGIILLTQRKYLLGFITTLLFSTLITYQNHLQIDYYTFLIAVIIMIVFLIRSIRSKDLNHVLKAASLALVAGLLGVLSYAVVLIPTSVYAKETMRGGRSELTTPGNEKNKSKGGLDKDYAFGYSYGITEVLTTAVPRMYGGSSAEMPGGSQTAKVFSEKTGMSEDQADQLAQSVSSYWGPQGGTSGAVYFGASVCLLFIFACVFYKGWHSEWIIAATILGILLAWGKHFSTFNYFLFDHLPLYNKFRAPSMAMVIPQLTVPLMACLGLNQLIERKWNRDEFLKKLKQATIISGIFVAVLAALYFMFDYKGPNDAAVKSSWSSQIAQQLSPTAQPSPEVQQRADEFGRDIVNAARQDRKSLFGSDLIRSLIFMAIAWALLYLYGKDKLKANIAIGALIAIVFIDLIGVDLRYLNTDKYVDREQFNEYFTPTAADVQISRDTGYYRVFNYSDGDPFQLSGATSRTSYWHNSVGGYHPAKLALYNDLITHQLGRGNMQVFNMLNTKYFVVADPVSRQPRVEVNPDALGPAWFVGSIKYVNNADEEMQALNGFHPRDTAIADKREQAKLIYTPQKDSAATITLIQNKNDFIEYRSSSKANGIAVFSEIYYPYGWTATIDGKEVPIAKVDYALRALAVPAGNHKIEFRFEPSSFTIGDRISLIVGILSILILCYGAYAIWKDYRKGEAAISKK